MYKQIKLEITYVTDDGLTPHYSAEITDVTRGNLHVAQVGNTERQALDFVIGEYYRKLAEDDAETVKFFMGKYEVPNIPDAPDTKYEFMVGDIVSVSPAIRGKTGEIIERKTLGGKPVYYVTIEGATGNYTEDELLLWKAAPGTNDEQPAPAPKFAVGDTVKIHSRGGQQGEVWEFDSKDKALPYHVRFSDGGQWVSAEDLELVTAPKFEVGQRVIVDSYTDDHEIQAEGIILETFDAGTDDEQVDVQLNNGETVRVYAVDCEPKK